MVLAALAAVALLPWPQTAAEEKWVYPKVGFAEFEKLYGSAHEFVSTRRATGFTIYPANAVAPSFQVRCKGFPVLRVERTKPTVALRLPADALERAPETEALYLDLQQLMAFNQVEGVSIPDGRARPWWRAGPPVPRNERCAPPSGDRMIDWYSAVRSVVRNQFW
ncbi:hypothetical protein IAE57_08675 [Stenotrophomonas sp. S48]|uniref:hypothetical protein n=1 Tax=unclassified Stenotrophomonas TaxID=196198 RepID=UPI001900C5D6|nr:MULTISPECIES: hypothetical protein [unclassified Stenotrophomonas]MBK0026238.1 hypothetical protein [Stenotrophomonas sp. S48]MBK0049612.1 hypothetical protein [Stenotrophomonas sp. S49]